MIGWVIVGTITTAGVLLADSLPPSALLPMAVLTTATLVSGRLELDFDLDRSRASYTIVEVAATAGLLLVEPGVAVSAVAAGTILSNLSRGLAPLKVAFNGAVAAAAMVVAALTWQVVPAVGPLINGRPVLGVALGMLGFVAVNLLAIVGLVRRLEGPTVIQTIRDQIPLTALTVLGQVATGAVVALVAVTEPLLVPLVLAPAGAIHLAARGSARSASLLTTLRSDRDRLTRVVDGASDGIVLLDGSGTIQVWNPAMTGFTGIEADDAIGQPVAEVLTDTRRRGDAPVRGRWLIDAAHDGPTRRETDAHLSHLDGSRRTIREHHALVHDERGRCTGDVVVVRDVSRQYELDRLRSDFVARVSHELRTPLTPIRGFASVLLRKGDSLPAAQRHEALERILERADHLGTLVEDLLLVTRVDQGDLDELVRPKVVGLTTIAEAAIVRARTKDPLRPMVVHTGPATPEALADPDRTGQILDALLDNACRYSPDGTPVQVLIDHVGDDVRVRVTDQGPGIPRGQHEVIFERFHRLEDPLTMRTSGVGLGLFLARKLTEAMHGTLEVEEAATGLGASFALRLPTAEPAKVTGERTA